MLRIRFFFLFMLLLVPLVAGAASIKDVRLADHGEYTRLVFELEGRAHYRISNLSEKYQSLVVELYGVESAPESVSATGNEKNLFKPVPKFDAKRGWYSLHLKTRGTVRPVDYTLKDPLRIVVDVYAEKSAPNNIAEAKNWSPPAASTSVVAQPAVQSASVSSWRRTIIIDPGHGGYHKGGWGILRGKKVWEKDVTIDVAERMERYFKADPRFDVKLTRREDVYVGLRERTALASQLHGDIFLSLHCNAVEGTEARKRARGFEIWTWNRDGSRNAAARAVENLENDDPGITKDNNRIVTALMLDALESQALDSRRLAAAVHGAFVEHSYFKKNDRGIDSARFTVLEVYDMPSILVELGFISHPEEVKLLFDSSFRETLAKRLYEGVVTYYEKNDNTFPRFKSFADLASTGK